MSKEASGSTEGFLVDKQEAAGLLGVSVRTIDNLIERGELRARKIGRRVLLRREDVRQFAEAEDV